MEVLIAVGIFALVFGVLYFTLASRAPVAEEAIQRRLDNIAAQPKTAARLRLYDAKEETFWETVEGQGAGLGDEGNTARYLRSYRGLCGSGNGRRCSFESCG